MGDSGVNDSDHLRFQFKLRTDHIGLKGVSESRRFKRSKFGAIADNSI